ncbi:MAG: adenine deaminase [Spirochaetales bacterium]|nr:adenine deaminase [Spirochaetales bacterium]
MKIRDIVPVALGNEPADVLIKNARIVNIFTAAIEEANIALYQKRIAGIGNYTEGKEIIDVKGAYVVPGFIDAHLHIESSMLSPREFARAVLPRGTTTVIADPHEITNVLGTDGLEYLIESTDGIPLNVYIALPSAVPATDLETAGARLGPEDMVSFVAKYPKRIIALGEVMNYPGVLNTNNELITKIEILRHEYRKIDGHAPGMRGKELNAYISAFIRSDHECTTAEEALEKVSRGMQVLIREGTAAKNLGALIGAVTAGNQMFFSFCTDDREPVDIIEQGHINHLVSKAVASGLDPISAVRMATINTARHYNLRSMGAIAPGYKADMLVLDDLVSFNPTIVIKDSKVVAENRIMAMPVKGAHSDLPSRVGLVKLPELTQESFKIEAESSKMKVIGMRDGELYTDNRLMAVVEENGYAIADPKQDLAKVIVFDRHKGESVARAFATGFGIKRGAVATSIGHDAHNLCCLGMNDEDMLQAAKLIQEMNGGIVVVVNGEIMATLPLAIAGLMSSEPLEKVVEQLSDLKAALAKMGTDKDILMPLHFIQLAVIPELKITDQGLVDVFAQKIVPLFQDENAPL